MAMLVTTRWYLFYSRSLRSHGPRVAMCAPCGACSGAWHPETWHGHWAPPSSWHPRSQHVEAIWVVTPMVTSGGVDGWFIHGLSHDLPSGKLTVSYWIWPLIVDFPIKNGDFPVRYVSLPDGKYWTRFFGWYFHVFPHKTAQIHSAEIRQVSSHRWCQGLP
jgi:hypothetical protein